MSRVRRTVFAGMLVLGGVLGVAHAKDQPKLTPVQICIANCGIQKMLCEINNGGKTWVPDPDEPTVPSNPNPNGTAPGDTVPASEDVQDGPVTNGDPGCKAIYDGCKSDCIAQNPNPNPN